MELACGPCMDATSKSLTLSLVNDAKPPPREGINGRALTTGMNVPGGTNNMTVGLCINACQAAGYVLSGVEDAGECCRPSRRTSSHERN
jgi:hypothetical protein